MSQSFRSFVAVPITATREIREVIEQLGKMGRPLKPVDPDNLHITLTFIGDTPHDWRQPISEALDSLCSDHAAGKFALRGLGVFPRLERPTVCWAGIEGGEFLGEWKRHLDEQLVPLGFTREQRPYRPHLTLARVTKRPPDEFRSLIEANTATEYGSRKAGEVVWFRSDLTPAGPVYKPIHRVKLRG